jgi:hypothetical protein
MSSCSCVCVGMRVRARASVPVVAGVGESDEAGGGRSGAHARLDQLETDSHGGVRGFESVETDGSPGERVRAREDRPSALRGVLVLPSGF